MTVVVWTLEAADDREQIFDYVAERSPAAAVALDDGFIEAIERLEQFPNLGKSGRVAGTRELIVHENYTVVYEWSKQIDQVLIVALVHQRMRWPQSAGR